MSLFLMIQSYCICYVLMNRQLKKVKFLSHGRETGSKHFAPQDRGLSQIFKLIVSAKEKILKGVYVVV